MPKDSMGVKLGIAFGFLIILLVGVGWLGLSRMERINAGLDEIFNQDLVKLDWAHQALTYAGWNYRMTMTFGLMKHTEPSDAEWYPPKRAQNREKVDFAEKKIKELVISEKEKELLDKIDEAGVPATASVDKLVDLLRAPGKRSDAQARAIMAEETIPLLNKYRDAWVAFIQYENGELVRARQRNEENYAVTRGLSILLILLAIGVAIGIAAFVTRRMSRSMKDLEWSRREIRGLNEDLEKKVTQRTEELARTVETLKGVVIELKAREKDLRRLAAIVEGSDDAIVAASLDGIITEWNSGAERMFGYFRNEIVGKPLTQITPLESTREPLEFQEKLRRGETVVRAELMRLRKGGKPVHVAITVSPIVDDDGRIVGGSAIMRDITQRKIMEDALRRSEANYRSFVENAPYGILRTTRDGRIVQANPALVEMLGYASEQEVLNLNVATDVYLNPKDREEATLWCLKQDSVQGIEVDWKDKSGRPFTIRCAAHVVKDHDGTVEFLEGFVEDISERRALEQQLRQGQKMEAIGRLAGGIAHDFNNLLGVIIGYGDLATEQIGEGSPLRGPVEQIRKAADRASALTRQLLAFSRQQVLEMRVLNLNAVVAEMEKMLPPLLGEDIQLETLLEPALGSVKADQGQIEQVIMNLAVNARDAMPGGGRLLIQTSNAASEEFLHKPLQIASGQYVRFLVKDTGTGMDARTQAHIFEPFFTTKEPGKGTGLGLATVYGFVKQSGGYIWVESEPGAGTAFTVLLPQVRPEPIKRSPNAVAAASRRGTETILLVEDEESLRTLARSLLIENGYTVLEAGDGMEALEIARQYRGPIDLLLTDMVMPGMSGQTVAERLALIRPEIRVLYMSGYTRSSSHGLADLDASILPKPFTRDTLLHKLRETLDLEERTERV